MRGPWDRLVRVRDGTALGGAVRLASMSARYVVRDLSIGAVISPPWDHWITYPHDQNLHGGQTTALGAFDITKADQIETVDGVFFLGYVMWWEEWFPGGTSWYRRAYLSRDGGGGGGGGGGSPGPDCPTAGAYTVGVPVTSTIAVSGTDWWRFAGVAGQHYTINVVDNVGNLGATWVEHGTCAMPAFLGNTIAYPWNFGWMQPANDDVMVHLVGSLMATSNYTMTITSP